MYSYLLGGSNGERRLVSLRVFAECRSEQEWTAGQFKGDSAKAISYYLVCRVVAPLSFGNGSVREEPGQVPIFSIKDQLYERLRNVAHNCWVLQFEP
jgi:hypothetical protein